MTHIEGGKLEADEQIIIELARQRGAIAAADLANADITREYLPRTCTYLRYHYYSGAAYELGIEQHLIKGVSVKVYSPAKTVVDCFRLRSKVDLDVALEALKEGWQAKRFSVDELMPIANQCRIAKVIRPHFEMLVA